MSSLILQSFQCIEETNEVGSDSPYFVIFHGNPNNPAAANVKRIRKEVWDNDTDTGETKQANSLMANNVDKNSLVLVAFLEEDDNADVSGGDASTMGNAMRPMFTALSAGGSASADQLNFPMTMEFLKAIKPHLGNDEFIGLKRLKITALSGQIPMGFQGDGGNYSIKFKMV